MNLKNVEILKLNHVTSYLVKSYIKNLGYISMIFLNKKCKFGSVSIKGNTF
ncbi:hypothetical protein GCM10007963_21990 [Lutibacter litoralis]|nr:hypothetical protein GCM10007963_21990 [Lutibacter litoralis]